MTIQPPVLVAGALYRRIERLDVSSTITRRPPTPAAAPRRWSSLEA